MRWSAWVKQNAGMSESHAAKFRKVAELLEPYKKFGKLSLSFDCIYANRKNIEVMLQISHIATQWQWSTGDSCELMSGWTLPQCARTCIYLCHVTSDGFHAFLLYLYICFACMHVLLVCMFCWYACICGVGAVVRSRHSRWAASKLSKQQ